MGQLADQPTASPGERSRMKAHVLVIDDEAPVLAALRRLLRREFEVFTANSGAEGLDFMQENEVQVILTDQRMPGMTGVDFLADVKTRHPDATRLLFTGYADLESVIQAINEGNVYRYLVKPWNPDELLGMVREANERYELIVARRQLMAELQRINAELEQRVHLRTEELAAANVQLRELNRLKDDFIAITSHDLRSPLTAILGAAELLQDISWKDSDIRDGLLTMIEDAGRRMLELVNNLLDLARLEAGGAELHISTVSLAHLLGECISTLAPVARGKAIGCALDMGAEVPDIQADNARLYQVFNNLLSNALKFTDAGGQIKVSVRLKEPEWVTVCVTDTGRGIAPDDLPKLFNRFRQTSTRATRGEQGSGLGLSIVRQLVHMHHGEVHVSSTLGVGTTFTVRLPIKPPAQA